MAWKFWLVAASYEDGGVYHDCSEDFIQKGKWQLFYEEGAVVRYDNRLAKIDVGDRIAIKAMNGRAQTDITIKAIGIVKGVDVDLRIVYVDWIVTGLKRVVDSRGCFGSIHGPYKKDNWVRRVFSL